jgi:hypothetical protein
MFLLGAILLARKPVAVSSVATPSSPLLAPGVYAPPAVSAALSRVDAEVGNSLDALKETMFRLELRHQAGTISDEDYATERAKVEKILRDLVRG